MKNEIIGSSKDSERNDECIVVHFFCVSEDTFSSTLIVLVPIQMLSILTSRGIFGRKLVKSKIFRVFFKVTKKRKNWTFYFFYLKPIYDKIGIVYLVYLNKQINKIT